jgi:MFS family permease
VAAKEPAIWRERARTPLPGHRFRDMFCGSTLRITAVVTFMNACALFGWWGLNGWIPAYLRLPTSEGGVGLGTATMSWFVVAMPVGMWLGYVSFGYISDSIGRKRVYVAYLLAASVPLPLYGFLKLPIALLLLGPLVAFFGTGYFSGFGVAFLVSGAAFLLGAIAWVGIPETRGRELT